MVFGAVLSSLFLLTRLVRLPTCFSWALVARRLPPFVELRPFLSSAPVSIVQVLFQVLIFAFLLLFLTFASGPACPADPAGNWTAWLSVASDELLRLDTACFELDVYGWTGPPVRTPGNNFFVFLFFCFTFFCKDRNTALCRCLWCVLWMFHRSLSVTSWRRA